MTRAPDTELEEAHSTNWYLAYTAASYAFRFVQELKAQIRATGLEDCFEKIIIVSQKSQEQRGKRTVIVSKNIFPGCIFIRMKLTAASKYLVLNTPKSLGVLGRQSPRPISEAEIARMILLVVPQEVQAAAAAQFGLTYPFTGVEL